MKKIFILICFILTLSLISCSNVYEEIIISDIKEYDSIWSLSERRVAEGSLLFPNNVTKEQSISFLCKHSTYRWLGTGWQLVLEVKYSDKVFLEEVNRLDNLCIDSPVCGSSEYFENPTYATVWNWNGCFEYAVIDEKEKTICYIYLQLIANNDLTIDERYIFKGYEMQLTDSETYSVYEKEYTY